MNILVLLLPYNITAQNEAYNIQVLKYGTDSDIVEAFSSVQNDLGDEINKIVPNVFNEKHTERVYSSMIRYIGVAELGETNQILHDELQRKGMSNGYKEEVIRVIGKLKKRSSVEFLRSYYFDSQASKGVKRAIIDAWGNIGENGIERTLIDIIRDIKEDEEIRAAAVLAIGKVGSEKSLDLLREIVLNTYEEKVLRMYAVHSLGKIGGEAVLDTLGGLIYDETHEVAEYAVNSIAEMGSNNCGEWLMYALRSDYDKVRYYAVIGLSKIKYYRAVEILEFKSKHDSNESVRKEAEKALEVIKATDENNTNTE